MRLRGCVVKILTGVRELLFLKINALITPLRSVSMTRAFTACSIIVPAAADLHGRGAVQSGATSDPHGGM